MAENINQTNEDAQVQAPLDPWEQAFAALDSEEGKDTGSAEGEHEGSGDEGNSADQGAEQNLGEEVEPGDGSGDSAGAGAIPDIGAGDLEQGGDQDASAIEDNKGSSVDIETYRNDLRKDAETKALTDVAKMYIDKGARHTNGKLGATIEDQDIRKVDSRGQVHYYNPETGREFTGDNPRRKAQEWCDDYNKELAAAFNNTCEAYVDKLMQNQAPALAMIEFEPTYDSLDPVRQSMLDDLIEDYEIKDKNGEIIGYSCDLNKALAAVNRQVRTIQNKYRMQQQAANPDQTTPPAKEKSSPALDMKSSAAAGKAKKKPTEFKSIAEAMEWEQDQMLENLRAKDEKRKNR